MTEVYRNAFTEVYEILSYLDDSEYNKIPPKIIKVLEKNKNPDYNFWLDDSVPLQDQEFLPETRAILFNLFRDYFANPKQKEQMINYQLRETYKLEEEKKANYQGKEDLFGNKNSSAEAISTNNGEDNLNANQTSLVEVKKESAFTRMIKKIKSIFKK